ncbi:FG-GAP repeat domain-containing protein [Streptomyces sp. GLT-R25]
MPPRTSRTGPAAVVVALVASLAVACGGDGSTDRPESGPKRPAAGKPSDNPDPGDFNGDGYDDFATFVYSQSKDKKRYTETLAVVYGSSDGLNKASAQRTSAGGKGSGFVSAPLRTDLDGDGFTDLVVARGKAGTPLGTFALFGGARGLGKATELALPDGFQPRAAADFDGDGSVDLLDGGRGGTGDPSATGPGSDGLLLYGPFDRTGTPKRRAALDLDQQGYATPESGHHRRLRRRREGGGGVHVRLRRGGGRERAREPVHGRLLRGRRGRTRTRHLARTAHQQGGGHLRGAAYARRR